MPTTPIKPRPVSLENKILKAKELGIKFKMLNPGDGASYPSYDTIYVYSAWNDSNFEEALDKKLEDFSKFTYISLLKKHELI